MYVGTDGLLLEEIVRCAMKIPVGIMGNSCSPECPVDTKLPKTRLHGHAGSAFKTGTKTASGWQNDTSKMVSDWESKQISTAGVQIRRGQRS